MKSIKVWDLFVRIFHWTLVGSILGLYISGDKFKGLHIRFGYLVIGLVLARVVWGFIGTKYARFGNFLYKPSEIFCYLKSLLVGRPIHYLGHNPAGGLMIAIMLISLIITTAAGLKALAMDGQGPLANLDGAIVRLAHADEDEDQDDEHEIGGTRQREEFWEEAHESMTHFMIALIVVHLVGVLVSSWIHKENLILSMITGKKKVSSYPG